MIVVTESNYWQGLLMQEPIKLQNTMNAGDRNYMKNDGLSYICQYVSL